MNEMRTSMVRGNYIFESVGEAACLELLAEEACELSKEALKLARILRGENPTPATYDEIEEKMIEEFSDLMLVSDELGLFVDSDKYGKKRIRWEQRLQEKEKGFYE